jgi:hypothetical protein
MSEVRPLQCVVEATTTVEYGELERFIKDVTGHEYEIPFSEDCGNDSWKVFRVDGKLSELWDLPKWENFKTKGHYTSWMLQVILNGLCKDGHLSKGKYIVHISW